jgi:hypothetical protein
MLRTDTPPTRDENSRGRLAMQRSNPDILIFDLEDLCQRQTTGQRVWPSWLSAIAMFETPLTHGVHHRPETFP